MKTTSWCSSALRPSPFSSRSRPLNLPLPRPTSNHPPSRYPAALTPLPSNLRPHVAAVNRLREWKPYRPHSNLSQDEADTGLDVDDPEAVRVKDLKELAWDESTRSVYGSGLLVYHVFCDARNTPEEERAPISRGVLESFVAAMAGSYSSSAINNYICGIRAWHLLHGLKWEANKTDMELLIRGAQKAAPKTSTKEKRDPFTVDYIVALKSHLDLTLPLDAAVFACLTTAFYATARLGELTVKSLKAFNPMLHVKITDVRESIDRNGLKSKVFRIPVTKVAKNGEDIYWSKQNGESDPEAAFRNHIAVNTPPPDAHLFSYQYGRTRRPLTKKVFLHKISQAAREAGLQPKKGHAIRIGSTLEYLLRGIPFEAMKHKGRWASEAFTRYLTRHAQILAPYMQAVPQDHQTHVLDVPRAPR
ncbi:hypothetical protein AGABI1DRAFT_46754 [Agaricus bisporus var. burnettii JB137-S8]|uniref:Tyr recombinase domain-containing protein n=1 Tax=Agaricus bisporus var. burnettii (strain JB137-S8 / ATCC MYA-4627 / FGSC 10392) TaxID=597362 RepID=K5VLH7_AGABU|nr:uncharacterized protein AGABI1DRAFT_46754 [Agaricus bisporus var. burnettii JB137-S8]EKM75244.1 hypothetical protein AGABI1DRAFT_46754 [Agaricus bisporus var. burnettii JB137-S8]